MSQDDVRVSPELIAQLNKLASRLTAQGEYEACDLIDTVVERVSAMPQRELLAEALDAFVHIGEYWNGSRTDGAMSDALDEIVATASAAADKIRAALEHQHQQKGEKL